MTPPDAPQGITADAFNCEEFYGLMQAYRHADLLKQSSVVTAFKNVTTYIRRHATAQAEGWMLLKDAPVQTPGYLWAAGLVEAVRGQTYARGGGTFCGSSPDARGYDFTHWHPPIPPPSPRSAG